MSVEMQGQIPPGTLLRDSNKKEWIVGSFIGVDGSGENYAAAEYKASKKPTNYPAFLKVKTHGDERFISEIDFYQQHVNPIEIAKWNNLGIPRYLGTAQNVLIGNTHFDFLVLERCGLDFQTLLIKHNNLFPTPTVLKVAYQIVHTLEYFHQRDFKHGDVHAKNIRLGWNNESRVKLLPQVHLVYELDLNDVTFWSEDRHFGAKTKIGDLESLLYNLIDWSGGILPWKNQLPDVARDMKMHAFRDPKQFLQKAFPTCQCKDPSGCSVSRRCAITDEPVAPFKCLFAISELMDQVVSMKQTGCEPDYKKIKRILESRLLNMYHLPTSKLDFSIPTIIGDEDRNKKSTGGARQRVDSYLPGLEIATDVLAMIIAENCSNFDEVHTFDSKSDGVIDVILRLSVQKRKTVIKNIIQQAWEKNTQKLRTKVIKQWRLKGRKPGDYKVWEMEKQESSINERKAKKPATEVKKNAAEEANHESPVPSRNTSVNAKDGHPRNPSLAQPQKCGPIDKSSQQERKSSPTKRCDSNNSHMSEIRQKWYLPVSLSPSPTNSNRIHSPVSSIGSSGYSSLRHFPLNSHPDVFSPSRTSEQPLQPVYYELPEKAAPKPREEAGKTDKRATEGRRSVSRVAAFEPREEAGKTDKRVTEGRRSVFKVEGQWHDTYELLKTWLDDKEQTLVFGPIPSEPQLVAEQVKRVRMHCDDYRMRDDRIGQLTIVLASLPPDSNDAEKLKGIKQRWESGLARSESHGRELGEASLGRLRKALEDVSSKLDQLFEQDPEERLLRKVESLAELIDGEETLLVNTEKVVDQLVEIVSDSTINSDLYTEFENLNKFYEELKQKIEAKKVEIERNIQNERQFDHSCQEILVWLVNEQVKVDGISEKPLVLADRETLQKQHEDYKVVRQRIMARKTEVMELLTRGRDVLSRQENLENRNSQKSLLNAVKSSWERFETRRLEIDRKFQTCVEDCKSYDEARNLFAQWLDNAEKKLENLKLACVGDIKSQLKEVASLSEEARKELNAFEGGTKLGDPSFVACGEEERINLTIMKERWRKLNNDLLKRMQSLDDIDKRFADVTKSLKEFELRMDEIVSHDPLRGLAGAPNFLNSVKEAREKYSSLRNSLDAICQQANELVSMAGEHRIDAGNLSSEKDRVAARFKNLNVQFKNRCDEFLEITSFKKELEEPIPFMISDQEQDVKPMIPLPQIACSSEEVIDLVSSSDGEDFASDASKINITSKRKNKLSRRNVNRLSDSESDGCENIEKKKKICKEKKDNDPDWNSVCVNENINRNVDKSPRFVLKKKKCRGKTCS